MRKAFLTSANYLIEFDDMHIKTIQFNDANSYRNFAQNVLENIIFSIDNNEVDLNKYGLIIYDPFNIDLNDKKLIGLLYKKLEKNIFEEEKIIIGNIEQECLKLFELLSLKINTPIDYNNNIDYSKLFSSFEIKILQPSNYLEKLLQYLSLITEIFHTKLIISFGLLPLLTKEEINLLDKELIQFGLSLIDIQYHKDDDRETLYIEEDWCII